MTAASRPRFTVEEYVRLEDHANVKHEYFDGQIFAMAGGTPEHAAMASAIIIALGAQLRGRPCRVYTSDVRVRVIATGLNTYPDVTVVCGHEEHDVEDKNALTNPVVLVEITSDSSEKYDRGDKLESYKRIPSLEEVVLVSHRERKIAVYRRAQGWLHDEVTTGAIELSSIRCSLDVEELFRNPLAVPT
ncbi:MAG: Uma2 family endonuclease [Polyangiales bacterium]